jgi:hypothetical protein
MRCCHVYSIVPLAKMQCCQLYSNVPLDKKCGVVLFVQSCRKLNNAVFLLCSIAPPAQQCGIVLFIVSYHQLKKAVLSCLKYRLCFRLQAKVTKEREIRPTYILNHYNIACGSVWV